jgi:predicted nucleic acid-binding protein
MKENNFINSNILIYSRIIHNVKIKNIAQKILLSDQISIAITQFIKEAINVLIQRFKISLAGIQKIVDETFIYLPIKTINHITIQKGLKICKKYSYSYYDSLIIASALQNECSTLYTEDLHHKQKIEKSVTIINLFI